MPWPGWRSHAEGVSVCGVPTANLWQSRQADQAADVGRPRTSGAEFAQAGGLGRLREFPSRSVEDEAVVTVGRLRQAEEKAAMVSVKMTIPLVLFILPSLIAVVMGPAIVMITQSFAGTSP